MCFITIRHFCSYFSCTKSLLRIVFFFSFRDGKLSDLLRTITCLTLNTSCRVVDRLRRMRPFVLRVSETYLQLFSASWFFRFLVLIGVFVYCLRRCFVLPNLYTITVYPTTNLFCTIPEITVLFCDVISKNAVATNQRFAFIIHIRTTSDTYEERIVSTPCSGSTVINSLHVCVCWHQKKLCGNDEQCSLGGYHECEASELAQTVPLIN